MLPSIKILSIDQEALASVSRSAQASSLNSLQLSIFFIPFRNDRNEHLKPSRHLHTYLYPIFPHQADLAHKIFQFVDAVNER